MFGVARLRNSRQNHGEAFIANAVLFDDGGGNRNQRGVEVKIAKTAERQCDIIGMKQPGLRYQIIPEKLCRANCAQVHLCLAILFRHGTNPLLTEQNALNYRN
jgi:hypothetical protein